MTACVREREVQSGERNGSRLRAPNFFALMARSINAVTGLVLLLCCTTTAALRLLASGLTPAERLAATSAVDAELVEFFLRSPRLLVAGRR